MTTSWPCGTTPITWAYTPEALLKRFEHQTKTTFRNRIGKRPKPSWDVISYGLQIVGRTLWHAGVASEWRSEFWKLCGPLLRQGRIEDVVHIGIVAVHLLTFVEDIKRGRHEAAFYADANLKRKSARVRAVQRQRRRRAASLGPRVREDDKGDAANLPSCKTCHPRERVWSRGIGECLQGRGSRGT